MTNIIKFERKGEIFIWDNDAFVPKDSEFELKCREGETMRFIFVDINKNELVLDLVLVSGGLYDDAFTSESNVFEFENDQYIFHMGNSPSSFGYYGWLETKKIV